MTWLRFRASFYASTGRITEVHAVLLEMMCKVVEQPATGRRWS